ncbi:hypothetical protein BGZ65_008923 [Modicella reniformis]|uniref:Pirin C-terminal domain-containing protein n=1 Tax=Modicella reniformis TaxID=1440133 RepID=A0A9P6IMP0_9FUNG|nr:hypothetical protein BGZ65_008923 [Modicella reniformis]
MKTVEQSIPAGYIGLIYMLKGTAYVGDKHFEGKAHHTLTFSEDGAETIKIRTKDEDAHFVVIAGEPLKEPIMQTVMLEIMSWEAGRVVREERNERAKHDLDGPQRGSKMTADMKQSHK